MPTYEYECEGCGHSFERFQSMTARPVRTCPECGERKVRRLIGAGAGLIFKGSGFYTTDYRSEGYKQAAKKEGSDSSKGSKTESDGKKKKSKEPSAKATSKAG